MKKNLVVYRLATGGEISQLTATKSAKEAYEQRSRLYVPTRRHGNGKKNFTKFENFGKFSQRIDSVYIYDEGGNIISFVKVKNGKVVYFPTYIVSMMTLFSKSFVHNEPERASEYKALIELNIALTSEV